jgi:hypothetical protein
MTQAANLGALGTNAGTTGIVATTGGGTGGTNGAIGFKNRLINGAMVIDQRNSGASVTITDFGSVYTLDRWRFFENTDGVITAQQSTTAPVGFTNSLLVTVSTADTSIAAGQLAVFEQKIEGFNIADLGWGTANAKTVTLSFWVRSNLTGTFGGSLRNSNDTRSYPFSYTINSANTFELKTVTIAGDTSGTWNTTNGIGIHVTFGLAVGSNFLGTAGSWSGSNLQSSTGQSNLLATIGNTFYITGVQLEVGSAATNFDVRSYGTELGLCQRYYWKIAGNNSDFPSVGSGVIQSATSGRAYVKYPISMRTYPTFSYGGTLQIDNGGFVQSNVTSISGAYEGLDTSMIDFAASGGGLTTGRGCVVYCSNASTDFLQASAEL